MHSNASSCDEARGWREHEDIGAHRMWCDEKIETFCDSNCVSSAFHSKNIYCGKPEQAIRCCKTIHRQRCHLTLFHCSLHCWHRTAFRSGGMAAAARFVSRLIVSIHLTNKLITKSDHLSFSSDTVSPHRQHLCATKVSRLAALWITSFVRNIRRATFVRSIQLQIIKSENSKRDIVPNRNYFQRIRIDTLAQRIAKRTRRAVPCAHSDEAHWL